MLRRNREYEPYPEKKRRIFPVFLLGVLLAIVLFLWFARKANDTVWGHFASIVTGRKLTMDNSLPAVVSQIQRLQRLETVSYSMDKVVEGEHSSTLLPDFLGGDKLLMVVHGEVIAGIDLSQLQAGDVHIDGHNIQVHLPPAQIFFTAIDNTKTRVYSRDTGLLVPQDPNLESQVRASAQQQIQQAALSGGILATAAKNAGVTVAAMLHGLGFQQVTVD